MAISFSVRCIAGPVLLTILASGCATITRGTTDQVLFSSTPDGATVLLTTGQTCETPCKLKVSRKTAFTADFKKEGFKPASVKVKTRISGRGAAGAAGNILIGGVIGIAADAASGATLDHYPNPVVVTLEPSAGDAPPSDTPQPDQPEVPLS